MWRMPVLREYTTWLLVVAMPAIEAKAKADLAAKIAAHEQRVERARTAAQKRMGLSTTTTTRAPTSIGRRERKGT